MVQNTDSKEKVGKSNNKDSRVEDETSKSSSELNLLNREKRL
jgi:hypothetical protein